MFLRRLWHANSKTLNPRKPKTILPGCRPETFSRKPRILDESLAMEQLPVSFLQGIFPRAHFFRAKQPLCLPGPVH